MPFSKSTEIMVEEEAEKLRARGGGLMLGNNVLQTQQGAHNSFDSIPKSSLNQTKLSVWG